MWLDKISSLPPFFLSSYSVLSVSTVSVVSWLEPQLKSVMARLQEDCIHTMTAQCQRLIAQARDHLEVMHRCSLPISPNFGGIGD